MPRALAWDQKLSAPHTKQATPLRISRYGVANRNRCASIVQLAHHTTAQIKIVG